MTNLFQPWILLRLASALTIAFLFVRASATGMRVLRHFDVARSNEGQLLLERRVELAATYARVAAIAAVLDLGLGVLAADRLSHSLRGAMCAYAVFTANANGPIALGLSIALALAGGLLAELYAFDASLPRLDLARLLSMLTLLVAPLAIAHAAFSTMFLLDLDLTATASCCSTELDGAASASLLTTGHPRAGITIVGAALVALAALTMLFSARGRLTRSRLGAAAVVALAAGVAGTAAVVLGVAPHAFEAPHHLCPFCLLRPDVYGIGYLLFGALYLALVWALGATVPALFSRLSSNASFGFARARLRRSAAAWSIALLLGAAPVLRYAWMTGGTFLFP
jgi:hypothetical protein